MPVRDGGRGRAEAAPERRRAVPGGCEVVVSSQTGGCLRVLRIIFIIFGLPRPRVAV